MTKDSFGFSNPSALAGTMTVLLNWDPCSPWVLERSLENALGSLRGTLGPSEFVFQETDSFLLAYLQMGPRDRCRCRKGRLSER